MKQEKYQDMLFLEHPTSKKHPRMSLHDRAAQFSPFAALTGHEDAIDETGRLTQEKMVLTEQKKEELDHTVTVLQQNIAQKPMACITFFIPDEKKEGGKYTTVTERVSRINSLDKAILLESGRIILVEDIYEITLPSWTGENLL